MKNNFIKPRNDIFYYIEVEDIQLHRDHLISEILCLSNDNIIKYYLIGSQRQLVTSKNIQCAIFWKNIETAELRIKLLRSINKYDNYHLKIKSIDRNDFIKIMNVKPIRLTKYEYSFFIKIKKHAQMRKIIYKK